MTGNYKLMQNGIDNLIVISPTRVGYSEDNGNVVTRFGWGELRKLGRALCVLVGNTSVLILKYFGENETIAALLELIAVLCKAMEIIGDAAAEGTLGDLPPDTLDVLLSDLQNIIDKYSGA